MRDRRAAQARFVGEHAAGDAVANGRPHCGTSEATGRRGRREGMREHQGERRRDLARVHDENDQPAEYVGDRHERHQRAGDSADPANAEDQHQHQRPPDDAVQPDDVRVDELHPKPPWRIVVVTPVRHALGSSICQCA
jgi:hypothetical protein